VETLLYSPTRTIYRGLTTKKSADPNIKALAEQIGEEEVINIVNNNITTDSNPIAKFGSTKKPAKPNTNTRSIEAKR
jgi:hypothetical protein